MRLAHAGSRALARERHDGHRNADAGRPQAGDHRGHDRHRRRRDGGHAGPAHREAVPRGVLRRRRLRGDARLQLPPRSRHRDGAGPRLQGDELGKGLRRLRPQARHGDDAPDPLAPRHRSRPLRRARPPHARGRAALAARHPQETARPSRCDEAEGVRRVRAGVLPVRRQLRRGLPEGLSQPQDERVLHRGLPHPADDQGRRSDAGDPERAQRRRYSRRELQG